MFGIHFFHLCQRVVWFPIWRPWLAQKITPKNYNFFNQKISTINGTKGCIFPACTSNISGKKVFTAEKTSNLMQIHEFDGVCVWRRQLTRNFVVKKLKHFFILFSTLRGTFCGVSGPCSSILTRKNVSTGPYPLGKQLRKILLFRGSNGGS